MRHLHRVLSSVVFLTAFGTAVAQTPKQPARLDLQVELTADVKAKKAKPGDVVVAQTMVPVTLPGGSLVPAGAKVIGHVVQAEADSGETHASFIAFFFESIQVKKGQTVPVNCFVRAAMMPALKGVMAQQQGQGMPPMQAPSSGGMSGGPMMSGGYGMGGTMGGGNMGGGSMGGGMGGSAGSMGSAVPAATQAEETKPVTAHTGEVIGMRGVELQLAEPNHVSIFRSSHKNLELYEGLQMMLAVR